MRPMNMVTPLSRLWLKSAALACCWLASVLSLHAQAAGSGSIQGRVFNPVTRDYIRDAEVRLEGSGRTTFTENDGSFRFDTVPAGPASITVNFVGYTSATENFTVTAGQVATRE